MLRASLALLRDFRRALGVRRAAIALPRWLVRREFSVLLVDLSRLRPVQPVAAELEWTPLAEPEIPRLLALNPALVESDVRRWLEAGHECMLARLDGEIVHFRTYVTGRVELPYLGRALRLEEGDVLLGMVYTAPTLRRRGLLSVAARWSAHHVRSRGHRRMVAVIASWNEAPLRAAQKVGMEVVGVAGAWRLGPWRRSFARGRVRFDAAGDLRLPPSG
ncbi:MAG TPA: GNAT family N-acetyltransferase [Thermoanaerobaculia bacterium]|nr:GNAT family N-acetyltransferase [Thermoanaerobaculia bacterium]